ncbi:hypothetical protein DFS33DRAFT_695889 [Desarmillaria ectypa]|nr:hypothetical protein DFS33DRAFT_695889 [Desarmillaria ectypa]
MAVPSNGVDTFSDTGGANAWYCQHRWTAFTTTVRLQNNIRSSTLIDWVLPQSSQITFGQGSCRILPSRCGHSTDIYRLKIHWFCGRQ